jgi:hypothetical protein
MYRRYTAVPAVCMLGHQLNPRVRNTCPIVQISGSTEITSRHLRLLTPARQFARAAGYKGRSSFLRAFREVHGYVPAD